MKRGTVFNTCTFNGDGNGTLVVGRQGAVLILVLVIVAALTLSVYSFSSLTLTEYEAGMTATQQIRRRVLAESGVDAARAVLRDIGRTNSGTELLWEQPIPVPGENFDGQVCVIQSFPDPTAEVQFGLYDESARLNINSLELTGAGRRVSRRRLMALPGMTVQIADAILDWLDPDDEPGEYGAESDYYSTRTPPAFPRQGPIDDLAELLLVRGVTEELLFGDDRDRDGRPDDARVSEGEADFGLAGWLTVRSLETTLLPDGRPKIGVNSTDLALLYDEIEAVLDTETADFIVAARIFGITHLDAERPDEGERQTERRLDRLAAARARMRAQLGLVEEANGTSDEVRYRGGMRLPEKPAFRYQSIAELFGGQVRATVDGEDRVLLSPFPSDAYSLSRLLPMLEELMTTAEESVLRGRININTAPRQVLKTIPGMNEARVSRLMAVRQAAGSLQKDVAFRSPAWLVSNSILTPSEFRQMARFMTTGGSVRSGVAVGLTRGSPVAAAVRFRLRADGSRVHVEVLEDLPPLPRSTFGL